MTDFAQPVGGLDAVVKSGLCIGCGACAYVARNQNVRMSQGRFGFWTPLGLEKTQREAVENICPFSDAAKDEYQLAKQFLSDSPLESKELGRYRSLLVGHVAEGEFRARGSSGGLGKWILSELLNRDEVDYVIQVGPVSEDTGYDSLFQYRIYDDAVSVMEGSKSAYYPVQLSDVLNQVSGLKGRFAITGVPCFIKSLRLLMDGDDLIRSRVRFLLGMFCGHMKSPAYAELLAWQLGIPPNELGGIDFRGKFEARPANVKGVFAWRQRDSVEVSGPAVTRELFGGGYNDGFFQHKACDYCDDIVAETADVSIGDAWLPEYVQDGAGTSILVVRNRRIEELLAEGIKSGRLYLDPISEEKVIESQAGGIRHRREGLSYRLALAQQTGEWIPKKRVKPDDFRISKKRKHVYDLRIRIREESHLAFEGAKQTNDLAVFFKKMSPVVAAYRMLYKPSVGRRVKRGVARRIERLRNFLGRKLN